MSDPRDSLSPIPDTLQKLLKLNLRLFPLKKGSKLPAHKGWQQEAAHGIAEQLKFWTEHHPNFNVGIATGCYLEEKYRDRHTLGLLVVDFDKKSGGLETFETMFADKETRFPKTLLVKTCNGGYHLYFHYPAAVELGNRAGWRQGVDIRAQGGYVVAPGCHVMTPSGIKDYRIVADIQIAKAPVWLLSDLLAYKTKKFRHSAEVQ